MLMEMLGDENISVVATGTNLFESSTNLMNATDIFQPEVRIYFLNMYSNHARRVLCAVSILFGTSAIPTNQCSR
jgi:hypothetical protein